MLAQEVDEIQGLSEIQEPGTNTHYCFIALLIAA